MRRRGWPTTLLVIGIVSATIGGLYGALQSWKNHICTGFDAQAPPCRTATILYGLAEAVFVTGLVLIVCAVIGYATDPARNYRAPWQPPQQ